MNYKLIENCDYQRIMDQYKVDSLLAKIFAGANWNDNIIDDLLSNHSFYDISKIKALSVIHDRILMAQEKAEKVFVGGDYDCDGICGTSIVVRLLNELGISNGYYIPSRINEGYGLNVERTKQAIEKGYSLFILVDNGVKAFEALKMCKDNNVDVIVLDHHDLETDVDCYQMFHPDIVKGPFSYLCGAGCAFEVVRTFENIEIDKYLILAMIATIGDMVNLYHENRVIVKEGLKKLNDNKYETILRLFDKHNHPFSEVDIAYQIVPKINSIGRLAKGNEVNRLIKLFTNDNYDEIKDIISYLFNMNNKRKELTKQIINSIDANELTSSFPVLYDKSYDVGIVGLVANNISHKLKIPIMVAGDNKDLITGSIRAPYGVNVMEIISPIADLLDAYGGHAQAMGLTFKKDNLKTIENYLENIKYDVNDIETVIKLETNDLTVEKLDHLFNLSPFGQGINLPLVAVEPEIISEKELGKPEYKKWFLKNDISAISFNADKIYVDKARNKMLFIGNLKKEIFNSKVSYVIQLEEIWK